MSYKCKLCGKSISELRGAYLTRVNEKGVPGIWECRPTCEADLPQETLLMMAIESDDKDAPNNQVQRDAACGGSAGTTGSTPEANDGK